MSNADVRLNVILVDDEKEACDNLKYILKEYIDPDINITAIANNTSEAEKLLSIHNPDALFLDIEMPNENAFQFLERVSPIHFEVIFVTAYDEYAIKAFKLNAVDYILKPISISELSNAVTKLKERIKVKQLLSSPPANNDFSNISKQISNKSKLNKIALKDTNNVEIVSFRDLIYIEACGGYSKVFFLKNEKLTEMLTSVSISEYEELLPDTLFYRIHKSYLVNCGQIKNIHKDDSMSLTMYHAGSIPISRRRFSSLVEFLQTKPDFNE